MIIDAPLVGRLIRRQFPHWAELSIAPVENGGWDNRSFRLENDMVVRLPSAAAYAAQVAKEQLWLPRLASGLPLRIPTPIAMGAPSGDFPWPWSIYEWIDGETAAVAHISDRPGFASDLAAFLTALEHIDPSGGPPPGRHNFYRGGSLTTYDAQTRRAIAALEGEVDAGQVTKVWEAAIATSWDLAPVWLHGDVSAGNLIVESGRLAAVIDFGCLGIGDPACDLAIAWTLFEGESRDAFRSGLQFDDGVWARARGWTLWKALIVLAGRSGVNTLGREGCGRIIEAVLSDHSGAG